MADLTARGVKLMLTRACVDYSGLVIKDDPAVWVDVETGAARTSVVISGPKPKRDEVNAFLFSKGLAHAPYPEYDMWSRR
jgi:hypothetical protein